MTQRVFDMENEQDVKDLFDILPDDVKKLNKCLGNRLWYSLPLGKQIVNVINVNWGSKISVDRPVDKSKWIGCMCWFWDGVKPHKKHMAILKEIDEKLSTQYIKESGTAWEHCRPVKRSEIKFVEDGE